MEIWKRIVGFSAYEVSNRGRIRSMKFGEPRLMRPKVKQGNGYLEITMMRDDGARNTQLVHRLVAIAFIPRDPVRPTVNHKDGNKIDNRVTNLEWATLIENNAHSAHKRFAMNNPKRAMKLTAESVQQIREAHAAGEISSSISKRFAVSPAMIRNIVYGRAWRMS